MYVSVYDKFKTAWHASSGAFKLLLFLDLQFMNFKFWCSPVDSVNKTNAFKENTDKCMLNMSFLHDKHIRAKIMWTTKLFYFLKYTVYLGKYHDSEKDWSWDSDGFTSFEFPECAKVVFGMPSICMHMRLTNASTLGRILFIFDIQQFICPRAVSGEYEYSISKKYMHFRWSIKHKYDDFDFISIIYGDCLPK